MYYTENNMQHVQQLIHLLCEFANVYFQPGTL